MDALNVEGGEQGERLATPLPMASIAQNGEVARCYGIVQNGVAETLYLHFGQ